jgi:hypothetical protein
MRVAREAMPDKPRSETVTVTGDFSKLTSEVHAEATVAAETIARAIEGTSAAQIEALAVLPQLPDLRHLSDPEMAGIRTEGKPKSGGEICPPHEVIERLNSWNRNAAREMEAKRRLCELFGLPIASAIPSDDNYPRLFERAEAVAHQLLKLEGPISFSELLAHYEVYRAAQSPSVASAPKARKSNGGRPREKVAIDRDKLNNQIGATPRTTFARLCNISDDVLQEACNHGLATDKTLRAICKYLRSKNVEIKLKDFKNPPQKPQ